MMSHSFSKLTISDIYVHGLFTKQNILCFYFNTVFETEFAFRFLNSKQIETHSLFRTGYPFIPTHSMSESICCLIGLCHQRWKIIAGGLWFLPIRTSPEVWFLFLYAFIILTYCVIIMVWHFYAVMLYCYTIYNKRG